MRHTTIPWQVRFGLLSLIWGSSFLLIKAALRAWEPLQVGAGRILFGALATAALALATRSRLPRSWRVWAHLQVTAFLLATAPFVLFPLGEERVSSALAGIGNATTPLATVLATFALLPQDRLSRTKLGAVAVGFVGVVVIMAPWEAHERPDLLGFGMTLVAGGCYGVGWTYLRRFLAPEDLGGLSLPAAQLLAAAGQMLLVLGGWWLLHREQVSWPFATRPLAGSDLTPAVLALAALGVVGTGLAYWLQFDVVRAVGQQVASTVTYVIPVVAVALGVLVLHERLTWPELAGAAIVVGSAIAIGRAQRPGSATADLGTNQT